MIQTDGKEMTADPTRYFRSRLNGETQLSVLFWRDMMLVGSVINLLMMVASIAYLGNAGTSWIGAVLFLAPLPYNIFLVFSVFRTADRQTPNEANAVKIAAFVWMLVFVII
jgi:hypothetical protein